MVKRCNIPRCREPFVKGGSITFHTFPRNPERAKLWAAALRQVDLEPTSSSLICSKHFSRDCFDTEKFGGTWLKSDAVPNIFDLSWSSGGSKRKLLQAPSGSTKSTQTEVPAKSEQSAMAVGMDISCSVSSSTAQEKPKPTIESSMNAKRKYFLGDFDESDMTCPQKATHVLQTAKEMMDRKTSAIKLLRRACRRYENQIERMSDKLGRANHRLRTYAAKRKSDTTSVDHDVSAHLELELTTSDSTDSEIKIKEEPMSDTEEEGGALGFLDIRSLSTQADESSQHRGVSTTLVPSVFSVCTLSKPPPGEILGVPVGDLPMCPGLPSPPGANSSATTGVKDNNTSQSSANSINDTDEETKVVPEYRTRDQFDVYGEYIATKLRGLDLRTSAYVQKAFADILFEAEMGKYSSHTNLQG